MINFSEQISISPNVYRIVNNSTARSTVFSTNHFSSSSSVKGRQHQHHTNTKLHETTEDNGIINSVENFQIAQQPILPPANDDTSHKNNNKNNEYEANVLAQPQILNKGSTTTTTESPKGVHGGSSSQKTGDSAKLVAPPILQAPTVKESKSSTPVKKERRLPEGVVPPPETSWMNKETQQTDNRYANAIDDTGVIAGQEQDMKDDRMNFLIGNEQENLAHEVPDNDFNIDEKKVNPENPGGEDKIDNNAEEDTNLYETNKDVFNTNNKDTDILHGGNRRSGNADTKLRNEVAGDHGKEGDHYPDEDLRIEGQNEEEGDSK